MTEVGELGTVTALMVSNCYHVSTVTCFCHVTLKCTKPVIYHNNHYTPCGADFLMPSTCSEPSCVTVSNLTSCSTLHESSGGSIVDNRPHYSTDHGSSGLPDILGWINNVWSHPWSIAITVFVLFVFLIILNVIMRFSAKKRD